MKMNGTFGFAMLALVGSFITPNLNAQTTLSGDHIIAGDLNVGVSGTVGNILVTGETGSSASPGLKVTGDGGVVFTGTYGVGQVPMTGEGTRFMWYPKKAALRAGTVLSWNSDEASIGGNSVGIGYNVRASGSSSTVFGAFGTASGVYAFSAGDNNVAGGQSSVALGGQSVASSLFSAAIGSGVDSIGYSSLATGFITLASGTTSSAFGSATSATGFASSSFGEDTISVGYAAVAFGISTMASGTSSLAGGENTIASGQGAVAFGVNTTADAFASVALGYFNVGGGDSDSIQGDDPLFEIGNGTGDENDPPEVRNRNALTVYKNGNITIPKRQGDILMGEFGNEE